MADRQIKDLNTRSEVPFEGLMYYQYFNPLTSLYEDYKLAISDLAAGAVGNGISKKDYTTPAFVKTGNEALAIKAGTKLALGSTVLAIASDLALTLPVPLVAWTDYTIYFTVDATIITIPASDLPAGYSPQEYIPIGGFYFAGCTNPATPGLGSSPTASINEASIWDLKFKPACGNARGMTFSKLGRFWFDIWPMCRKPENVATTSKYNEAIADGRAGGEPFLPTLLGGNGVLTTDAAPYTLQSMLQCYGKSLPSLHQFRSSALGVIENTSRGSNWNLAEHVPYATSMWGGQMMTGCGWTWCTELLTDANEYSDPGFKNIVGLKGQFWQYGPIGITQLIAGGGGFNGANSGSYSAHALIPFNQSIVGVGARGYCAHIEGA